jgi:hypothetical protein
MATMTADFHDLIAVSPSSSNGLQLLGHIVFYSIPEEYKTVVQIADAFSRVGLAASFVPPAAKPVHRFQAACRSVEQRRSERRNCEVKVAQIDETPEYCLYQVHFLVRDRQHRVVEHPKALRVTFTKQSRELDFEYLNDRSANRGLPHAHSLDLPSLAGLEERIRAFYRSTADSVPGAKLRTIVRKLLVSVHAEPMRDSGGVYFVPINGKETLNAVGQAVHLLYPSSAEFATIPLANDAEKRRMIRNRLTVNTIPVIDDLLSQVTRELRAAKMNREPVGEHIVNRFFTSRRRVAAVKDEYAQLLNDELGELAVKIEILDQQLETLTRHSS